MTDAYSHPDYLSFLAAIRADPKDDTHRLVAADWLDEHGEPERAEFIRVQVAAPRGFTQLSNIPHHQCHRGTLLARWVGFGTVQMPRGAAALAKSLLPPPDPSEHCEVSFRRGFLSRVHVTAGWWLSHGDAILAQHPTVKKVTLTTWPEGSVTRVAKQRPWRIPPRLGGHILDCWRAEWPGVAFELPPARTVGRIGRVESDDLVAAGEIPAGTLVTMDGSRRVRAVGPGDAPIGFVTGVRERADGSRVAGVALRGAFTAPIDAAMTVAGLEATPPVTREQFDAMVERVLRDAVDAAARR